MLSTKIDSVNAKYGPRITTYFNELGYNRPRELAPSLTGVHIADAVKSLVDPERATYQTFETLMALEWSPLCDHIDLILDDHGVYPLCIKLLRSVCSENRGILENAYGFMCLQFMTLALDIAKIVQGGRFSTFQEEICQLSPGHSIRLILNNHSRVLEGERIFNETDNTNLLGCYLGCEWGEDGHWTFLPQIGGCRFLDTVFLSEQLWNERKQFIKVAQVASGIFPSWGGLLYVIWHAISENHGLPDNIIGTHRDRYEGTIFEIGLRYAMCSDPREDPLVYVIINQQSCLRWTDSEPESFQSVDIEDADQVASCAIQKLRSMPTINNMNHMSTGILSYASMLLCPQSIEQHVNQLYEAAFQRAWREISVIHRTDTFRWCTFAVHLESLVTYLYLLCKKHGRHPGGAIALRTIALDWDLYELYARTLLSPLFLLGPSIETGEFVFSDEKVPSLLEVGLLI
ncbi:unnamed protein product [Rhizoctonia solani]|uniref:Uncharacterized protein n=1 Tax=Rhizoctonia solani TaxID=456999 RepID=A0A8H3B9K2_9AGAM|nr:unnamed protein product [Rhizoctonia solani]